MARAYVAMIIMVCMFGYFVCKYIVRMYNVCIVLYVYCINYITAYVVWNQM